MYHCGCHGSPFSKATRYMYLMPIITKNPHTKYGLNMDLLKTKELLMHHCGCHGNLVTIAMTYVADAYRPKEPPYQI